MLKIRSIFCRRLLVYRGPRFLGLVKIHDLALAMASATRQRNWLSNAFIWAILAQLLGVIVMIINIVIVRHVDNR